MSSAIPIIIFLLSIVLQLLAATYALLLIRITGRKSAWILISAAMVLMAARRIVSFISIITAGKEVRLDIPEIIALLISILMLLGVLRIRNYFQAINLAEAERKQVKDSLSDGVFLATFSSDVGIALAKGESIRDMLQRCAEAMVKHLDAAFARIWTLNEKDNVLEMQASAGMYTHINGPHGRVPVGKFKIGLIAQEKKPHLTNSVIDDPRLSDPEWAKREGMAAFAGHPLIVADKVVGVMAMFSKKPLEDIALTALESVADEIASGIDLKRAEDSQHESESKLRTVTNTAADAIVMIDEKEKVTYWNPAAERMLGFTAEEIMGEDLSIIIPHRYREAHKNAFNRFVETGGVLKKKKTYEVSALRKDGSEVPVELSVSGVRINGRCFSVGIIRDISERKKLEAQLLQAQKMEAIGQLAGGVAHDFNNILTAIIGYGYLLQAKMREDDPLRINVDHILFSADRAANLTQSLLAFGRKQMSNPQPVNLNDLIKKVERLLLRVIGEHIEFKTRLTDKDLTVMADSGQIEQALMNLATNARDAMPHGGALTVETEAAEIDEEHIKMHGYGSPGLYALISFEDTGLGMDKETRERIFEPFFTTKEVGKGTGLGLAVVYGIIKQHNGYINCYSEVGKGTTFRIYLPLIEAAVAEERGIEEALGLEGGTETILVAEDEGPVRKLTKQVLEGFGYKVIEAVDGEDTVRKFMDNKDSIHLLLIDVVMPKINGREAYKKIKETKPDIKALFVSGYPADFVHKEELIEEGLDFIAKPIAPTALLRKLREILDRKE